MTISEAQSEKKPYFLANKNWKHTSYKPAPDEIIDAYEAGKKDGLSMGNKIVLDKFKNNLNLATKLSQDLFLELNKNLSHGFCLDLFLRIEGISEFEALFVVDQKMYLGDARKVAFETARKVKRKNKGELFSIDFAFLAHSDKIDEQNIFNDGYALKYEPRKNSKSRGA